MKKLLIAAGLAISTVIGMSACAVTSGQSTVGQYVDDATVTTRVKTRLTEEKGVDFVRIKVETLNGVVELSGFATTDVERDRAGEVARGVPDVKAVHNHVLVSPKE